MNMPNSLPLRTLLVCGMLVLCAQVMAQTRFWVGGSGRWDDATHWSDRQGGAGGAGVPRVGDDVRIDGPAVVAIKGVAWCRGLHVNGGHGAVRITGATDAELRISGEWRMQWGVSWEMAGAVHLVKRQGGVELDLRGILLNSDVVLDGSGSWSLLSDLALSPLR